MALENLEADLDQLTGVLIETAFLKLSVTRALTPQVKEQVKNVLLASLPMIDDTSWTPPYSISELIALLNNYEVMCQFLRCYTGDLSRLISSSVIRGYDESFRALWEHDSSFAKYHAMELLSENHCPIGHRYLNARSFKDSSDPLEQRIFLNYTHSISEFIDVFQKMCPNKRSNDLVEKFIKRMFVGRSTLCHRVTLFLDKLSDLNDPTIIQTARLILIKIASAKKYMSRSRLESMIVHSRNPDIVVQLFMLYKNFWPDNIDFIFERRSFKAIDALWHVDKDVRMKIVETEEKNNSLYLDILDYMCGNAY